MQCSPNDDYPRLELDEGSVLLIAASWEGCHVMIRQVDASRIETFLAASL